MRSSAAVTLLASSPHVALTPRRQLLDATVWRSESDDPQFLLEGELPPGEFLLFECDVIALDMAGGVPAIYFDFGDGFDAANMVALRKSALSASRYAVLVRLGARPVRIRFDPATAPGEFIFSGVTVRALGAEQAAGDGQPAPILPASAAQALAKQRFAAPTPPLAPRIAAVVHLYYEDLWDEFAQKLRNIRALARVYVTIAPHASAGLARRIQADFPCAIVRRAPNRGRDVLPFVQWLEIAAREGIDLVCKIHSKRSPHLENGEGWRRDVVDKLLGSAAMVDSIVAEFAADPGLGIVAPAGYVIPSRLFWSRNAARTEDLCRRMGRELRGADFDYVAGSMFWARLDALVPLRRLGLGEEDFELEVGQDDGTTAHALERCFGVAAQISGFAIGETANPQGTSLRDFAPPPAPSYLRWITAFEVPAEQYPRLAEEEKAWRDPPKISILMPTYNTRRGELIEALDSVLAQVYPHWELCVADDASTRTHVREVLEEYRKRDPRVRIVYRNRNGHISAASNSALDIATGQYVALFDHDDRLHPLALHYVAEAILANPGCKLVYTDEDKIDLEGNRWQPYFKSELNYELLLAHNMVSHLACYDAARMRAIGGFREGYEGAQDYDLVLRFLEGLDRGKVIHVPRVLYHWRIGVGSTAMNADQKPYAQIAAHKAIAEHLERVGLEGEVMQAPEARVMNRVRFAVPRPEPHVTVIIPTRDRADLLGLCVDSLLERTTYRHYAVLVVDNGSTEPQTMALFERLRARGVSIVRDESPFNFSALNNRAVKSVSSEFVCLMNNDIEIITPDWLEEMLGMAHRPGVGAVGARLWYPDQRLQHGGVIVGLGGVAGHSHKYLPRGELGYMYRAVLHQELSAVTAACLLIRRSIYEEVGGFDESLQVAFNDIDFCLRVREAGYRNLWTPYAEMIHHESASRGHETTPEKQARFNSEIERMKSRWGAGLLKDPAYSPNLTLDSEDFEIAWPPRVEPMMVQAA